MERNQQGEERRAADENRVGTIASRYRVSQQDVMQWIEQGFKMNGPSGGRMVTGPGGPTDDAIPAVIDGQEPAALSSGEFVLPAAAVAGAGDGDPEKGAAALQELSERLAAGM